MSVYIENKYFISFQIHSLLPFCYPFSNHTEEYGVKYPPKFNFVILYWTLIFHCIQVCIPHSGFYSTFKFVFCSIKFVFHIRILILFDCSHFTFKFVFYSSLHFIQPQSNSKPVSRAQVASSFDIKEQTWTLNVLVVF
jgi:hypothetical protein